MNIRGETSEPGPFDLHLREISWDADNPTFFDLLDEEGVAHSIPFHRVREAWRDGSLIWQRHPMGDIPA